MKREIKLRKVKLSIKRFATEEDLAGLGLPMPPPADNSAISSPGALKLFVKDKSGNVVCLSQFSTSKDD